MSEQRPLVSVIIPAFNQQAWLEQCLRSVLTQSVTDLEVLVVDDGSADATAAITRTVARQDGRVRLLQQANAGAGAARNHGLRLASGQFVHFVDADDWLVPDAYAHWQRALLHSPQADVLLANFHEVDTATGATHRVASYPLEEDGWITGSFDELALTMIRGTVVPWNRWLRRDFVLALGAWFDEIAFANDRAFSFRTLPFAAHAVLLGAALVNYRVGNPHSLKAQAGLPRMRSTLRAIESSMAAIAHLPRHLQLEAFALCMADVVDLVDRAPADERRAMGTLLIQRLEADWVPFQLKPSLFARQPWWTRWRLLRA